jgi:hypothetical protein
MHKESWYTVPNKVNELAQKKRIAPCPFTFYLPSRRGSDIASRA